MLKDLLSEGGPRINALLAIIAGAVLALAIVVLLVALFFGKVETTYWTTTVVGLTTLAGASYVTAKLTKSTE